MLDDLLQGNARYAAAFSHGDLGPTPARHLAVVTCMDARLDVYAMLGLELGDAHIIRNAGGRVTDDVLRSLIVSVELLGITSVAVIQHTDCGMTKVTNSELRDLLRERRGVDPSSIDFLAIDDHAQAIRNDVDFLTSCGFLPPDLDAYGLLYDVATGRVTPI
ncbi:MAG: carbonic anhydrase [Actinomycetota bacterium]|nr:carbonic anhydrase [Actinomycetota bacterium]